MPGRNGKNSGDPNDYEKLLKLVFFFNPIMPIVHHLSGFIIHIDTRQLG